MCPRTGSTKSFPVTRVKAMSGDSSEQLQEILAGIEKELSRLREALSLLGLKRCSQCGKFFRSTEPGALFEGGEPVCVSCVGGWWVQRRQVLCVKDRDVVERRLMNWLFNHHNAKLVQQPAQAAAGRCKLSPAACNVMGLERLQEDDVLPARVVERCGW